MGYRSNHWRRVLQVVAVTAMLGLPAQAVFADEAATVRHFEEAKSNEAELTAFLKEMPKGADLHNHVTGAIFAESMYDKAVNTDNLYYDTSTGYFVQNPGPTTVPASQLKTSRTLGRKFYDAATMRGNLPGTNGHDHFFDAFDAFRPVSNGMDPDQVLAEVVGRAQAQNVQYLELMTSVAPQNALNSALSNPPALDNWEEAWKVMEQRFPDLLAASKQYLDERDQKVAKLLQVPAPIPGTAGPTNMRYVYSVDRNKQLPDFFAAMACGMAIVQSDPRVVAVNMVSPEDYYVSRKDFESQMRIIDFLWRKFGKPHVTLHAGELTLEYSPVEVMRSRIRKSIEVGHAERIGHGVSIAWEDRLPQLLEEMRQKGVAVEICLTSNEGILGVAGDQHPLPLYREAGVPITLNTDDEGISRSNLTTEYVKAASEFKLSYEELKDIARNSLEYSFLPGGSLYINRDYKKLQGEFARVREPNWQPDGQAKKMMDESQKLAEQVRLERSFVEFEQRYH
ncbi:hypothetical protein GJ688_13305 [Heliobacillus mobilis]|uniref:adenosine deaminase n=1 Tax=Heliobacterium mobile TaxID=28064 RepID=A0A6I3SLX1_HELMO|nr:hypothetical protein [Heliobacterium mobile]MTV49951.1 hypothetical protein [Heliobacterium mobile]